MTNVLHKTDFKINIYLYFIAFGERIGVISSFFASMALIAMQIIH